MREHSLCEYFSVCVRPYVSSCVHGSLSVQVCLCVCDYNSVDSSCVRAPIESEQVGSCYYSPANHFFLC